MDDTASVREAGKAIRLALTTVVTLSVACGEGQTHIVQVTQISASRDTTCALFGDQPLCWGRNINGELGLACEDPLSGCWTHSASPVLVDRENAYSRLASGAQACGIDAQSHVRCWSELWVPHADALNELARYTDLALNQSGLCGLSEAGDVICAPTAFREPKTVLSGATALVAGLMHMCAIARGEVHCWGDGLDGQLGNSAFASTEVATPVTLNETALSIAAGPRYSCAATAAGTYCWGTLGFSDSTQDYYKRTNVPLPTQAPPGSQLGVGFAHVCWSTGSELGCFGSDAKLQLGLDLWQQSSVAITAGDAHTCALDISPPAVLCWGSNRYGALGDGITFRSECKQHSDECFGFSSEPVRVRFDDKAR